MNRKKGKAGLMIYLAILALPFSCCKIDYAPVIKPIDIYMAGSKIIETIPTATYWKNGTPTSFQNGSTSSSLFAVVADGKNIYTAGYVGDTLMYWKNGIGVIVGIDSLLAGSMAILDSSVYIAGGVRHVISMGSYSIVETVAAYWKDGVAFPLSIASDALQSFATSIAVSGKDVYIAGREIKTTGVFPKLWKNSNPIDVNAGTLNAQFEAITISGTDIFLAGNSGPSSTRQVATYWKNGVAFSLSVDANSTYSIASSIAVSGSDIYVAGWEMNSEGIIVAKFWRNGVATSLSDGTVSQKAYSIAVSGNDIYITGDGPISNTSILWKNGKAVPPFDGTNNQINAQALWIN